MMTPPHTAIIAPLLVLCAYAGAQPTSPPPATDPGIVKTPPPVKVNPKAIERPPVHLDPEIAVRPPPDAGAAKPSVPPAGAGPGVEKPAPPAKGLLRRDDCRGPADMRKPGCVP